MAANNFSANSEKMLLITDNLQLCVLVCFYITYLHILYTTVPMYIYMYSVQLSCAITLALMQSKYPCLRNWTLRHGCNDTSRMIEVNLYE